VVEDTDTDVLQGLNDLVGGVDVLFGRVALLSGVTSYSQASWGRVSCNSTRGRDYRGPLYLNVAVSNQKSRLTQISPQRCVR
jgi:hypothetical protein